MNEKYYEESFDNKDIINMIEEYLKNIISDTHREFLNELQVDEEVFVKETAAEYVTKYERLTMEGVEESVLNRIINCLPPKRKKDFLRTIKFIFRSMKDVAESDYQIFVDDIEEFCLCDYIDLVEYENSFETYKMDLLYWDDSE